MPIATATLVFAALNSVRGVVRFARDQAGKRVDLGFTVKDVRQGPKSVLAFTRITNNAEAPVTVAEVNLILGESRIERAPLESLSLRGESAAMGDGFIEVRSHKGMELYEGTRGITDLRVLDADLYLQPKESRTGWIYFPAAGPFDDELDDASLEFCIGDDLYVRERLEHFTNPRQS